jgi:hypothetical protein
VQCGAQIIENRGRTDAPRRSPGRPAQRRPQRADDSAQSTAAVAWRRERQGWPRPGPARGHRVEFLEQVSQASLSKHTTAMRTVQTNGRPASGSTGPQRYSAVCGRVTRIR